MNTDKKRIVIEQIAKSNPELALELTFDFSFTPIERARLQAIVSQHLQKRRI